MDTVILSKEAICRLIPHSGSMCLLDEIDYWDQNKIQSSSRSHLSEHHPLRVRGCLSIVHGIEYGAQAMAVHGGLVNPDQTAEKRISYLVAVKSVEFSNHEVLDVLAEGRLLVVAERIYAEAGNQLYQFIIENEQTLLLKGQAMVITAEKAS